MGRKYTHLTPAKKKQAKRLLDLGNTKAYIAKRLGVSGTTIYRHFSGMDSEPDIPSLYNGKDTRTPAGREEFFNENPPPKAYVWQLYSLADQKAFHDGTLTPERIAQLADTLETLRALQDFMLYCEVYEATPLVPHQRPWIEHMMAHEDAAVFAPPGAGKSFIFSVYLPCWVLAGGGHEREFYLDPRSPLRNAKVLLVSESEKQAQKNVRAIKDRLEAPATQSKLTRDFGRFQSNETMWQTGQIEVDGREGWKRTGDASLVAVGVSTSFYGFRADWTICDDFASPGNCETPDQADKLMSWMGDKVFTRSEGGARTFVIMARLPIVNDPSIRIEDMGKEEDDLFGLSGPTFNVMVSPAVVDYADRTMLWGNDPRFRSWQQLGKMRQKAGSPERFETLFNQVRYQGGGALARREWIYGVDGQGGCLDMDRGCEPRPIVVKGEAVRTVRVMSVDPSPTAYVAAILMDVPILPGGIYAPQIIDMERAKMLPSQRIALMEQWHKEHGFRVLVYEKNAAQRELFDNPDFKSFRSRSGVQLIDHNTQINKLDQNYGKATLSDDFRSGNIRIPYGDATARAKMQIFIQEALEEVRTDDTIMAVWFPKVYMGSLSSVGQGSGWPGYGRGHGRGPVAPPPRLMKAVRSVA